MQQYVHICIKSMEYVYLNMFKCYFAHSLCNVFFIIRFLSFGVLAVSIVYILDIDYVNFIAIVHI